MTQQILASIAVGFLLGVAQAGEDPAMREVKQGLAALNDAFEKGDSASVKKLMTDDHIAVTPYYGGPVKRAEQLSSLPHLKLTEYTAGAVQVHLLGRDIALVSYPLTMKGTFRGQDVPRRSFASAVWVRREGRWLERFYQETPLEAK